MVIASASAEDGRDLEASAIIVNPPQEGTNQVGQGFQRPRLTDGSDPRRGPQGGPDGEVRPQGGFGSGFGGRTLINGTISEIDGDSLTIET